jgi:hypothetical protein
VINFHSGAGYDATVTMSEKCGRGLTVVCWAMREARGDQERLWWLGGRALIDAYVEDEAPRVARSGCGGLVGVPASRCVRSEFCRWVRQIAACRRRWAASCPQRPSCPHVDQRRIGF